MTEEKVMTLHSLGKNEVTFSDLTDLAIGKL